jgi:hypothetical protein
MHETTVIEDVMWNVTSYSVIENYHHFVVLLPASSTLMRGLAGSSKLFVIFYQTAWCHIPEDSITFFLILWGEVRLSSLGTLATSGPIVPVLDDRYVWSS